MKITKRSLNLLIINILILPLLGNVPSIESLNLEIASKSILIFLPMLFFGSFVYDFIKNKLFKDKKSFNILFILCLSFIIILIISLVFSINIDLRVLQTY